MNVDDLIITALNIVPSSICDPKRQVTTVKGIQLPK